MRILFVCLGNICRSPTAEGVFTKLAQDARIPCTTDSAGTGDWHVGDPPYGPMQTAARKRGYDLSHLRARQITPADFDEFDLILAMDSNNLQNIEALRPNGSATPVKLFLEYADDPGTTNVPDPYYTREFDETLDLVINASKGLLATL